MITAGHIKELLDLQVATNVAYFGEDWKKVWNQNAAVNSIYREWAEFLDEVTRDWKVYDPKPVFDKTKAVYELVDVVHFMLCAVLQEEDKSHDIPEMVRFVQTQPIQKPHDLRKVTELFTCFMSQPWRNELAAFLACACGYLGIDTETYLKAHKRKNDRNRARAAGGVLQGKYDKSSEQPLTLEF